MILFLSCLFMTVHAQEKTLRVDYVFSGTDKATEISLERLYSFDGWAGRTVNLDRVPVKGNEQKVQQQLPCPIWRDLLFGKHLNIHCIMTGVKMLMPAI